MLVRLCVIAAFLSLGSVQIVLAQQGQGTAWNASHRFEAPLAVIPAVQDTPQTALDSLFSVAKSAAPPREVVFQTQQDSGKLVIRRRSIGPDRSTAYDSVVVVRIKTRYGRSRGDTTQPPIFTAGNERGVARSPADSSSNREGSGRTASDKWPGSTGLFSLDGLQHRGTISRGIITGNRKSLTVDSGLDLELGGSLSEDVQIRAILTDRDIPIQPQGTTQHLRQFDRVFLELGTPYATSQLGDFDLDLSNGQFARFSRRLQGASVRSDSVNLPGSVLGHAQGRVAGAVTRGMHRIQELDPVEGMQGPYRLQGKYGERFIVVIPGTENVYLDGDLLTRGESHDYTIDYATGELTFTSNHLISSDDRLRVEFQYTTHRFTRTFLGATSEASLFERETGNARVRFGGSLLREADSRMFADEMGLTAADSLLIAGAGAGSALRSGAEERPFDADASYVQYIRRDTMVAGQRQSVYVPAQARADSVYRVRFTKTMSDSAAYVRARGAVNGIAYRWVGPGNGSYEPIQILPRPQSQRLVDVHGTVEPYPGLQVQGEWARSVLDENRWHPGAVTQNQGDAVNGSIRLKPQDLEWGQQSVGKIGLHLTHREVGTQFQGFNRIHPIEFDRRWNLTAGPPAQGGARSGAHERMSEGGFSWRANQTWNVEGEWGRLGLGDTFRARRRQVKVGATPSSLPSVDYHITHISSVDSMVGERGTWLRQNLRVEESVLDSRVRPHLDIEQERRRQRTIGADTLAGPSFAFWEVGPGLDWQTGDLEGGSGVRFRRNQEDDGRHLSDASGSWTARTHLAYQPDNSFHARGQVIVREKQYADRMRWRRERQNAGSMVMNIETHWESLNRAVRVDNRYEVMTEKSSVMQETYVYTGAEMGRYVWEDSNGDGIRQVDEFLPEPTPYEGQYMRTLVPSEELEPVITGRERIRLQLRPRELFAGSTGMLGKVLTQVRSESWMRISETSSTARLRDVYLMQVHTFQDPATTMNGNMQWRQRLRIFPARSGYGIELGWRGMNSLNQRTVGRERRSRRTWSFKSDLQLHPAVELEMTGERFANQSQSQAFASRSYDISGLNMHPSGTFRFSPRLRGTIGMLWSKRNDRSSRNLQATVVRMPIRVVYRKPGAWRLSGRVERSQVDLVGDARGTARYELTDGRGPGTSYRWRLLGEYQINNFLQASCAYNGRLPAGAPLIHTFRMGLNAVF